MKINETIFALLTDADTILESMYLAIETVDPNYAEEMATYEQSVQTLLQAVPSAEEYLQARCLFGEYDNLSEIKEVVPTLEQKEYIKYLKKAIKKKV